MNKRDLRLKTNVFLNVFLKGLNMGINFILVPVLIALLGKKNYGIWITIYAFINWLTIFDIGLGQGLKLKLTKAFSLNRNQEIKKLISSTYFFVLAITGILFILFFLSYFIFNWSSILNVNKEYYSEINHSLIILIFFFLLIFVAKLIGVIYDALQFPFVDNLIKTFSQLLFLGLLVSFSSLKLQPSLLIVSVFSIVPLFLIYLLFNLYFFKYKSPSLVPKFRNVSKETLKKIIKPGISFFAIQIGCIILYSTDNIIIINLLKEGVVTDFNVYYKYYSIPFLFYNVYISSHWASFIDALTNEDFSWIKRKIRFFNLLFLGLILSYVFLFFMNEKIISIWIGEGIIPKDNRLSFFMILYYLISSFTTNYIFVINANGKLKIQLIIYVLIAIINIPLSVFFVKYFEMGSSGVIFSSSLCLFILLIFMPIQYNKIISRKAKGIWNK